MSLRIAPCSTEDLDVLLSQNHSPHAGADHRNRFAFQAAGAATYLLAWRGDKPAGRLTLYAESKYETVRKTHPGSAEINALDANPQGQGTGTALIAAAESLAAQNGHPTIGLAVEPSNPAARRLYRRLGYTIWEHGQVIDEWTELRDGAITIDHRDPCDYLIKPLVGG